MDEYQRRIKKLMSNGVPDSRWCSLLMYFLEAKQYSHLSEEQKLEVLRLLRSAIGSKSYSEEALDQVLDEYKRIMNAPCQKQIEDLAQEAGKMLSDFHSLTQSRYTKIQDLETTTVNLVEECTDNEELISKLRHAFVDVKTQLQKDVESLERMAFRDTLTNIGNRRAFDNFMNNAVPRWKERGVPLSLAVYDVDFFKKFNDRYGHSVGDQVLKLVAKHLAHQAAKLEKMGNEAIAARYGGEEFMLVVSGPEARQLPDMTNELRQAIKDFNFILRDNSGNVVESGLQVTVSAGVAICRADWDDCAEQLISYADKGLYEAKNNGRDRVYVYSPKAESGFRLVEPKPAA